MMKVYQMDKIINLYSAIYARTYKRTGLPMRLVIPLMKLIEKKSNHYLESHKLNLIKESNHAKDVKSIENLVVSLTSFPARIQHVWKTILSLKNQTYQPEEIILWLSKEEFKDKELPESLVMMQDEMFKIKFIEGNLRSHKKYFYVMPAYPDKTIITVDDDVYYHKTTIKSLVEASEKNPGCIIANRVRKIGLNKGRTLPYITWKDRNIDKNEKNLFQIGVDGVLYPPKSLPAIAFDSDIFMKLSPLADDVWLNSMNRLKGKNVVWTGLRWRNIPIASGSPSLEDKNCGENLNDVQINNVRNFLIEKLDIDIYA